MSYVSGLFGSAVFNDSVMKERLPKEIYQSLKRTRESGFPLEKHVATVVASVMKDWAVEKGATHFTHWFQPMTGITAEKHNAFISPAPDGKVIMEFSGRELIMGESDASSFPSGGLRATFEARGYTAWDPTSNAYVKEGTLYIPTAFCAYSGEALDQKTPLLRSMQALNFQALRVLRCLGDTTARRVDVTVGPEQEYFLIDKALWERRRDLVYAGRTLFGARPPKGQEMDDHYYGSLKQRVADFMKDVDEELWRLGVFSKTKHNEVAPAQHELAPIFETANISADHNQMTMEMLKKVAGRHGLACLLHEKPFEGINGSGKHDNWSLATDDGRNLFEPTKLPQENISFLLFIAAVMMAVDRFAPLLRLSVATAGNDCRLGANEAPPNIISLFLGDELTEILSAFEQGTEAHNCGREVMEIGVSVLPRLKKDTTDRNRTSPLAFTGNKFEFRMLGSAQSIAWPNVMLNTGVAESLREYADRLENCEDVTQEARSLLRETMRDHKRILFDGNNYSSEWIAEAERRGLPNLPTTVDAIPWLLKPEVAELFERHKVLSASELTSRYEIYLENYIKTIAIEAGTMLEMARREIVPAVIRYTAEVCATKLALKSCEMPSALEDELLGSLSALGGALGSQVALLQSRLDVLPDGDMLCVARYAQTELLPAMSALRGTADALEAVVGVSHWPFPTYGDLLYRL